MGYNLQCEKGCPLSKYYTTNGSIQLCRDAFGINDAQIREGNQKFINTYGGTTMLNATRYSFYLDISVSFRRIILTHGAVDCGLPYESTQTIPDRQIYSMTALYLGHIIDTTMPELYEPVALYEMRKFAKKYIDEFVKEAKRETNG